MRSPFRLILLIFLMLWLPAQGFAMTAVIDCDQSHQAQGMHAAHDRAHAGIAADRDGQHHSDSLCGDCDFCHQCGAAALPAVPALHHLAITGLNPVSFVEDFSSHFPESPQRPPLVMPS